MEIPSPKSINELIPVVEIKCVLMEVQLSFYILVRFTNTIRFSLTFANNDASQHFYVEFQRQRAMKHEGSACVKGCLDDIWPVTALTEISPSTSHHESVQCHNTQFTNGACVGSSGLLSCSYVYSQRS